MYPVSLSLSFFIYKMERLSILWVVSCFLSLAGDPDLGGVFSPRSIAEPWAPYGEIPCNCRWEKCFANSSLKSCEMFASLGLGSPLWKAINFRMENTVTPSRAGAQEAGTLVFTSLLCGSPQLVNSTARQASANPPKPRCRDGRPGFEVFPP